VSSQLYDESLKTPAVTGVGGRLVLDLLYATILSLYNICVSYALREAELTIITMALLGR